MKIDMPFLILVLFYLGGIGTGVALIAKSFYVGLSGAALCFAAMLYVVWLYSHSLKGCVLVAVKEKNSDDL